MTFHGSSERRNSGAGQPAKRGREAALSIPCACFLNRILRHYPEPLGPWRLGRNTLKRGGIGGGAPARPPADAAGDFFGLGTGAGGVLVTETAGWGATTCGGLTDCDWSLATCERSITTSF